MKQKLKMRVISALTVGTTIGTILLSIPFAKAGSPTSVKDTMSRLKASTSSTHVLVGTFVTGTWQNTETVTFNYSTPVFELEDSTPSCSLSTGDTCTASAVKATDIVTVTCSQAAGCSGVMTLGSFGGTNPTAGTKTVAIAGTGGFTGTIAMSIIDDDQVTVTATVDPTITFDIDVALTDTDTNTPYSIELHTLTTAAVTSSGTYVSSTWINLATNATDGAVVTVTSTYAGLRSSSTSTDAIDSQGGTMVAGTENYGLCVISVTQDSGGGGPLTAASPFNGTCAASSGTNVIGAVTSTSAQAILNTTSLPIAGGRARISINASISAITPAHNDYTDTLTFIATGTF